MSKTLPFKARPAPAPDSAPDALSAIKSLIQKTLSREEQNQLLRDLGGALGEPRPAQAGAVLTVLRRVLPQQSQWTVAELKHQVGEQGVAASAKEIYNALNYLNRTGQITRVSYGQYLVAGGLLVTADDLGGELGRHEDLSDDQPRDRAYNGS